MFSSARPFQILLKLAALKNTCYYAEAMLNIAVEKTGNENNTSLIRRFTKRVQEAGILRRVRGIRYSERSPSKYSKKKKTLKSLKRREEIQDLLKRGIAPEILKRR